MFSNFPFIYIVPAILFVIAIAIFKARPTLPRYRPMPIMTANEREFFARLRQALPAHFVFPQVAMSALITPVVSQKDRRHRAAFARISQKRVDYAIYDRDLNLVCIVELDDRTHDARKDAVRDALLSSAGIRTLRWHSKNKPDVAAIIAGIYPPPPPAAPIQAARN